jgi:hypothetical protein
MGRFALTVRFMPVDFLTDDEAAAYGRYAGPPSQADLERVFFLDDEDRKLVDQRRGDHMKAGFALQLVTVRWLGTFLEDPLDVPGEVLDFVAGQLGIENPGVVKRYTERVKTKSDHQQEIRRRYGLRDFAGAEAELAGWVAARAWTIRSRASAMVGPDPEPMLAPSQPRAVATNAGVARLGRDGAVLVACAGLAWVVLQGDGVVFLKKRLQVDPLRVAGQAVQCARVDDGGGRAGGAGRGSAELARGTGSRRPRPRRAGPGRCSAATPGTCRGRGLPTAGRRRPSRDGWARRVDHARLGLSLQLSTVRYLGTFLPDPLFPWWCWNGWPGQLQIADLSCVKRYTERRTTPFEHREEVKAAYGLREFSEAEAEFAQWARSRAWNTGQGPGSAQC